MLKKLSHAAMALTMAAGMSLASVPSAEAGRGAGIGLGIAAGIIGLGILGATAHADHHRHYSAYDYDDGPRCYRGPRECHWAGRRCFENRWGDTVCRGGRYVCERQTICD